MGRTVKGRKPATILAGAAVKDVPRAPAWLSGPAKAEWRRVAPILISRNVLETGDLATLAAYCQAAGQVIEASAVITREGLTYLGASGPKRHPAVGVRNDAMNQVRLLGGQFGLNPVDRSRPVVRGDHEDDLAFLD